MKAFFVYFMTNKNRTVIYVGVTSNLLKRVYQHKTKVYKVFSSKFNCNKLIYFETFKDINQAMIREKQIKASNRKYKENLIKSKNPEWNDLSDGWSFHFDKSS